MAIRIYMRYYFGNQIAKGQKHLYDRGKRMTKKRNVDEGDNFDQVKTKGRQQKTEEKVNPRGGGELGQSLGRVKTEKTGIDTWLVFLHI